MGETGQIRLAAAIRSGFMWKASQAADRAYSHQSLHDILYYIYILYRGTVYLHKYNIYLNLSIMKS